MALVALGVAYSALYESQSYSLIRSSIVITTACRRHCTMWQPISV